MSKGNMLLGHARGKVGDLVFSRTNGQQITRARAAVVKNPQTESQMIQRIVMNTVVQAYSKMAAIVDHSFEGISAGQRSMAYFLKQNIKNVRQTIASTLNEGYDFSGCYAFTQLGANYFAPNSYSVAKGQLPEVKVTGLNVAALVTSIELPASPTYQDVIDAVGLKRGDQITFMAVSGYNREGQFYFARVILDPTNSDGSKADLSVPFIADSVVNLPSPKNEGTVTLSVVDGVLNAQLNRQLVQCAAVIISREKEDGSWLRSNATMYLDEAGSVIDGFSLQDALDALQNGGIDVENPRYLNNATATTTGSRRSPVVITDITVESATKGEVLAAGENGAPSSSMTSTDAISGSVSGNNPDQHVYAIGGASTKPVVGGNLPAGSEQLTISGSSFSGSQSWGDSLPGSTAYYAIVVAEDSVITQVYSLYVAS